MDPAAGEKDWLPDLDIGQAQTWPLELGNDRLMLLGAEGGMQVEVSSTSSTASAGRGA